MSSSAADFVRIQLVVQRLLDAEVLNAQDGAALMAEAGTGRRFVEGGDADSAFWQAERLAILTVTLVGSGELDVLDVRAIIETVGGILSREGS
jgi:hypothetical protein